MQPKEVTYYDKEFKSEAGPPPSNRQPNPLQYARVKITLVARPLLTLVAQKLCRCEHGVFINKTCVHF
jgi:hypothetical protein